MSSPCMCRTMPVSQSQLPEVKLSLKTSREVTSIRSSAYSSGKELPIRVSTQITRSRSTPPVSRVQCSENKAAPRTNGHTKHEPKNLPERKSSIRGIPPTQATLTVSASSFSLSTSSSSSYTSRLSRPSPPQKPSLSSSSSSQSMKRTRWLSHSTSNICFNSILDGRFRQLQGKVLLWLHPLLSPSLRRRVPSPAMSSLSLCLLTFVG
ncbi:spectrin beta chain, erythrocytic isoform X2 [Tachysurus ichikawai]